MRFATQDRQLLPLSPTLQIRLVFVRAGRKPERTEDQHQWWKPKESQCSTQSFLQGKVSFFRRFACLSSDSSYIPIVESSQQGRSLIMH
jgi:hypothetical protein